MKLLPLFLLITLTAFGQGPVISSPTTWLIQPGGFQLYGDVNHTNAMFYGPTGLITSNALGYLTFQGGTGLLSSNISTGAYMRYTNAILNVSDGGRFMKIGQIGGYSGIWCDIETPTTANFIFQGRPTFSIFNAPSGGNMYFGIGNTYALKISPSKGVSIGAAYTMDPSPDPGLNNLAVQGFIGIGTTNMDTNLCVAGEIRGSTLSITNPVASQAVGVGTDYSLTQTLTNVVFGTSGGSVSLPRAGTYLLNCNVNHYGATGSDDLQFRLYDMTGGSAVAGSLQHIESLGAGHHVVQLLSVYTVSAASTITLQAVNVTAARGTVSSTNTILTYVRTY